MKNAQKLFALVESLPQASCGVGPTGYLDRPVNPTVKATSGKDSHGRSFITLCVKQFRTTYGEEPSYAVITIFQRYSNDLSIWTQATNCGNACFVDGAMTDDEVEHLEVLVKTGIVTFEVRKFADNVEVFRFELVDPKIAIKANRRGEIAA